MRRGISIACLLALAGCGSAGVNPIVREAISDLRETFGGAEAPSSEQAAPRTVTRAQLVAQDVAAVRARLQSDPGASLMYAVSANGGYVTYASSFGQTITLRGARVTATRGLGTDLLSMRTAANDPLTRAQPLASWPARVQIAYEFPAGGARGRIETYDCRFETGEQTRMTIAEVTYDGFQVSEYCAGATYSFENLHFVEASSGEVWRSLQWIGPEMELMDLEILIPYTGN